jgi:AcrR family transcriptional regulator
LNNDVKLSAMPAENRQTRSPRTGRRPGATSSRDEILRAARRLFAEHGYEAASMRAIAAEAGVDAALLVHFFGSKAGLLGAAIEWPFDPEVELPRILADGRHRAGHHLVELFVRTWDEEGTRSPILTLLRAGMTEPQAAELLHDHLLLRLYFPLLERLGSDQPELRAELVASQLLGLGIGRYVLRFDPLASADSGEVVDLLAPAVQRYLTGKLLTRLR